MLLSKYALTTTLGHGYRITRHRRYVHHTPHNQQAQREARRTSEDAAPILISVYQSIIICTLASNPTHRMYQSNLGIIPLIPHPKHICCSYIQQYPESQHLQACFYKIYTPLPSPLTPPWANKTNPLHPPSSPTPSPDPAFHTPPPPSSLP